MSNWFSVARKFVVFHLQCLKEVVQEWFIHWKVSTFKLKKVYPDFTKQNILKIKPLFRHLRIIRLR